jgi:putative peptide modification system cyclase
MNAIQTEPEHSPGTLSELAPSPPLLRTVVACDLVESTALIEQLGDRGAADFMHGLDRQARDLLARHGGQEIDKTDGFLLLFERPIQAVAFALDYQRLLHTHGKAEFLPLSARLGIHVGDVVLWRNAATDVARGAKPVEIEGLVKPVAARLMSLALPGQILMSGIAHTLALRAQNELKIEAAEPQWLAHGRYLFKGVAEPMTVFEIGEPGIAPLRAPAYSSKAHREVPWYRRPGVLAIETAVLIAAVAIPAYVFLRSPPAIAFANRDWIVVGDLRNLTGQAVLDDSLDAAFRISLEQSRYVNLVSGLQIRDTLKRMEKPEETKIDRAIGSEIALREGARALILPRVAEIGGRVHVTAEVIDPHTQATVFVDSADGLGLESILPSVGKVSDDLRERLGETLASTQESTAPLPKVTTANLDALRAYALNLKAYNQGHWAEALSLLDQAIKIDPNFALAYLGRASVHLSANDNTAVRADLERAQALRAHMPPRDALRLDTMLATLGKPGEAAEKWRLFGSLYPDAYLAHYGYAQVAREQFNQYDDAIAELKKGLTEHNPNQGDFYYFLGALQLAAENRVEASNSLKQARTLRGQSLGLVFVAAAAMQRQFDSADKAFADSKSTGVASNDIAQKRMAITLLADQGHWAQALAAAKSGVSAAAAAGPLYGRLFRATELSLLSYSGIHSEFAAALHEFVNSEMEILQRKGDVDHPTAVFNVLIGAYLAAHSGDADLANTAISSARDEASDGGYPNLRNMLAIAEAERARAGDRAQDAIALLKAELHGTELYLTHVALRDAYASAGQDEAALDEAAWLAKHRGRAYEEYNNFQALQAFNVVESDLALLSQAELRAKLGKHDDQTSTLNDFLAAWTDAQRIPFVAQRLDSLAKH